MWKLTLSAGLCLILASLASTSRLMCYYNSKAEDRPAMGKFRVSDIDPDKCTHLIFAFSDISENELVPTTVNDVHQYFDFNTLKKRNPLLKTLLAVGGDEFRTEKFRTMARSQENREVFIKSVIRLLRFLNFDGLNLDWRYPAEEDKQRFTDLCKELKTAFVDEGSSSNQERLILSASVSAERSTIDASYDVEQIAMHLDFINVMTFDFHGPWESVTAHHSPLFKGSQDTGDAIYSNTASALEHWRDQGAPKEKLNMGMAAFGRAFYLSSNSSAVGAPASGPGDDGCFTGEEGFWAYYETCHYLDGVQTHLISDQKVPYATIHSQWVGFDDTTSISTKINYLKAKNFGGAFVWSLDLDDLSGQFCNQGTCPFVSQLHNLLVPDFPQSTTTAAPTTTASSSGNPCSAGAGHYPDPSDPQYYFNCDDFNVAHRQKCSGSLVFKESCKCCTRSTAPAATTAAPTTTTAAPTTTTAAPTTTTAAPTTTTAAPTTTTAAPTTTTAAPTTTTTAAPTTTTAAPTTTTAAPTTTTAAPTTTTAAPTTTTAAPTTTASSSGNPCSAGPGHYPDPSDPQYYFNCDDFNVAHRQKCSGSLVFKESCKCCTRSTAPAATIAAPTTTTAAPTTTTAAPTTTTAAPTTTTAAPTTTASASGNPCSSGPGLYPDSSDPSYYFNCDAAGTAHRQPCPASLVFKDFCKCCTYP